LDDDGIDAEILFPNDPARGQFFAFGEEFELACVQAHNDATGEWRAASDRYAPLLILPYLSPIETIVAEVERGARMGHRGITVLGEPSHTVKQGVKHFNDPFWYPLWEAAQELEMPIHFHESANAGLVSVPHWDGYSPNAFHTVMTSPTAAMVAQLIPNLVFSHILDRFPQLKWVCAEAGLAWINYVCEGCDHEWEQRHLWTEGFTTRPSELVHRQVYMNFWYEKSGIELRHTIGLDHIMWESDYPHTTSTYPKSWDYVEKTLAGVPDEERRPMLYENAMRVYRLDGARQ